MKIRKLYFKIALNHLKRCDFGWIFDNLIKIPLLFLSCRTGKALCGPILGGLLLTYKCNYHCRFCGLTEKIPDYEKQYGREFDTSQFKRMIDGLVDMGVSAIGFTGGEPLLRKDAVELMTYAKSKKRVVHLSTNGALLTSAIIEALLNIKIDALNISLDGPTEESHDFIRGAGSFISVIANTRQLVQARNVRRAATLINIVSVVNRKNIADVTDLVRLAKEIGADSVGFMPVLVSHGRAKQELSVEDLSAADAQIDALIKLKQNDGFIDSSENYLSLFKLALRGLPSPLTCYAGYTTMIIDCYGNVFPCFPWIEENRSIVNIKGDKRNLKTILYSPEYMAAHKIIKECRSCYWNCHTEMNLWFQSPDITPVEFENKGRSSHSP
ncbi:MAG: radical SAM protein [Kiritimatiellia bacterium]|nr:radical SAM protein [Kiritimatiellia bacterium]